MQAAKAAGYEQAPQVVRAHQRALVSELRRRRLDPELAAVSVSEAEIETHYQSHPSEFTRPGKVRAAIILVATPARARPEKLTQLAQRATEAREAALRLPAATRSFGSVAVKYSDDQATRYRGGDTGWIEVGAPRTRWDPAVLQALLLLREPGEISPVLTTDSGHYLVRLIERDEAALRPLQEVSAQIRHQLLAAKKTSVERRFHEELRETVAVSVNRELLRSVKAPETEEPAGGGRPPAMPE